MEANYLAENDLEEGVNSYVIRMQLFNYLKQLFFWGDI
jgi:hypothetical protein